MDRLSKTKYFWFVVRGAAKLAVGFTVVVLLSGLAGTDWEGRGVNPWLVIGIYWVAVPLIGLVLLLFRDRLASVGGALSAGWLIMYPISLVSVALFRPGFTGIERYLVCAVLSLILAGAYLPRIRRMVPDPRLPDHN